MNPFNLQSAEVALKRYFAGQICVELVMLRFVGVDLDFISREFPVPLSN